MLSTLERRSSSSGSLWAGAAGGAAGAGAGSAAEVFLFVAPGRSK